MFWIWRPFQTRTPALTGSKSPQPQVFSILITGQPTDRHGPRGPIPRSPGPTDPKRPFDSSSSRLKQQNITRTARKRNWTQAAGMPSDPSAVVKTCLAGKKCHDCVSRGSRQSGFDEVLSRPGMPTMACSRRLPNDRGLVAIREFLVSPPSSL